MSDEAKLETSDIQLKAILESLSLSAPERIKFTVYSGRTIALKA